MSPDSYVVLTACRNEANYIPGTIQSMLGQSVKPETWLILDDGSTDGTADLVATMTQGHPWIKLQRLEPRKERSFGAQYRAIMRGYQSMRHLPFSFIGVLDADISFHDPQYYEKLLNELRADPKLGIVGGTIYEPDKGGFRKRRGNVPWSVAGGLQTFRREVFEAIGGYIPLEYGGSDSLAVVMADMKGWKAHSLAELPVHHHRPTSTASGAFRGEFRRGVMDAAFGYPPFFMALKCLRRLTFKPYLLGSVLAWAGYCGYKLKGGRLVIPADALHHLRHLQRERLSRRFGLEGLGRALKSKERAAG
jgi:glycosyltransferase involved in cell wall biosynthesis